MTAGRPDRGRRRRTRQEFRGAVRRAASAAADGRRWRRRSDRCRGRRRPPVRHESEVTELGGDDVVDGDEHRDGIGAGPSGVAVAADGHVGQTTGLDAMTDGIEDRDRHLSDP